MARSADSDGRNRAQPFDYTKIALRRGHAVTVGCCSIVQNYVEQRAVDLQPAF
jgi:hypothetical protein